jgi:hypothetical protein
MKSMKVTLKTGIPSLSTIELLNAIGEGRTLHFPN